MPIATIIEPGIRVNNESGCWPTAAQELILRAALLEGPAALQAWEDWKGVSNLDSLDFGTHRMLPLVYHNLRAQGAADAVLAKLKSVHRYYFYSNQVILHRGAAMLRLFRSAGIRTMVLKGAALVSQYYEQRGLRPMQDFDIVVPRADALRAMKILRNNGWMPVGCDNPEQFIPVRHAMPFKNEQGHMMDLHWSILWECQGWGDVEDYWSRAVPVVIGEEQSLALDATDQLLHILWHGARWNEVPPIRWVADAMMVLKTERQNIEWDRLLECVERHRLRLLVGDALEYLNRNFDASVPSVVLRWLRNQEPTPLESFAYKVTTEPIAAPSVREMFLMFLSEYGWVTSNGRGWEKPLIFIRWLQWKFSPSQPYRLLWTVPRRFLLSLVRHAMRRESGDQLTSASCTQPTHEVGR